MTINPYAPPQVETIDRAVPPITDEHVRRLIAGGEDVQRLVVGDVSDVNLYGQKFLRTLTGSLADEARSAGCEPIVYQAVVWWCLVFVPVKPMDVVFVMPLAEAERDVLDDTYRLIPARWDRRQINAHYLRTFLGMALVAGCLAAYLARRFR